MGYIPTETVDAAELAAIVSRVNSSLPAEIIEAATVKDLTPREGAPDHFINSLGKVVYCHPLGYDFAQKIFDRIEKSFRKNKEPLDPPTYSFTAEGGSEITMDHDETTVRTDEEKAAWAAYIDARKRLLNDQVETVIKGLCLRGINYEKGDIKSELARWLEEETFMGTLPETELEQKYEFGRSSLIVTIGESFDESNNPTDDMSKCLLTCVLLGFKGASAEQIAEQKRLFRGSVEQARAEAGTAGAASA